MRVLRAAIALVAVFVLGLLFYRFVIDRPRPPAAVTHERLTVYYCKPDGETLAAWPVDAGSARDVKSLAFLAATHAIAGPPGDASAVRFPRGTVVRGVSVLESTAVVDLGGNVAGEPGGSFAESGEFKALVWTLTALPPITSVRIRIDGARVATLPGGHLELDEPLTRSSW
jgi:spore germination protein GerM